MTLFTDPRYHSAHRIIVAAFFVTHLAAHYATFVPFLHVAVETLPYFRYHIIHEAEFLVIVAYAGIVFGLKGGLIALGLAGLSSIPFILTPIVFGRTAEPYQAWDLALQVGVVLLVGFLIVLLYDTDARRRRIEMEADILVEANTAKNEFLSVASHTLRTPLTTLYGFSELLMERDVPEARKREWLERIYWESHRLSRSLDDMVNVTRIQSGGMAVQTERVEIAPVLEKMAGFVRSYTSNHTFKLEKVDHLSPVTADPDMLGQVMENLLSNAIKFSPEGGEITLSAIEDAQRKRLVVSVTDQGIGIAPADAAKLFTTFHRIRRPETDGIHGSGLGLYVTKSLVDLMGGEVWMTSKLGKGSTFSFSLLLWQPQGEETDQTIDDIVPGRTG